MVLQSPGRERKDSELNLDFMQSGLLSFFFFFFFGEGNNMQSGLVPDNSQEAWLRNFFKAFFL